MKQVDVPTADPARASQIRNGISYLLSESQIRPISGGYLQYSREAYKVVDRPGLEQAATINLKFDPARHKVTLNHLRVIRDGVVQDRLSEATFDIYRQEKDSVRGIFDGWLTARIDVKDARVGDIIDFGTSYEVKQIVGKDLFYTRFATQWEEPVALIRHEIVWPSSKPLAIRASRTNAKPVVVREGEQTRYLWEIANPDPAKSEDNLPPASPLWGEVEISSTESWQDVVDAVAPYYKPATTLPEEFAAKLDDIAARHAEPAERMTEVLRIVQDEVRYISLSMGAGSYIPRDPATVVSSGFGDCKDKALLLVSALTHLGIKAEVALADIDEGYALDQVLPTLRAFDHAIARVEIGSKVFWLDGTDYLQGGRAARLVTPDYGYVLPLTGSKAALQRMPALNPTEPLITVKEVIVFPAQAGELLTLETVTTYRDAEADAMRRTMASRPLSDLADRFLQYYAQQYPGIRSSGELKAADDRDANVVTLSEAYHLPPEALAKNDLAKNFPVRADLGTDSLPTPGAVGRVGATWLGAPIFRQHSLVVKNLKARYSTSQAQNVLTPYLAFRVNSQSTDSEFSIDWSLKSLAWEVPAPALADYRSSVDDIADNLRWTYDFTHEDPPAEAPGMSALEIIEAMILGSWWLAVLAVVVAEQRSFKPRRGQLYWPISTRKFVVMTLATGGLYGVLWGWRIFRQQNRAYGARYWAFLRGLFLPLVFVQTFIRINRDLGIRQVATWLGVACGLVLLGDMVYSIAAAMPEEAWAYSLRHCADLAIAAIAPLPLVVAINRINGKNPEYLAQNSNYTDWDKVWLLAGIFYNAFFAYYLTK